MDKPPSRLPLVIGCLLVALGWAAIYMGWQQTGEQRLEVGQIPYVVSGGFGGLGLILLGIAGILADVVLRTSWQQRLAARRLEDALAVVADRLGDLKPTQKPTSEEDVEAEEADGKPARGPSKRRTTRSRPGA